MKKTFFNFQDPINSYPLNERQVGVLKPGRYKGYTKMVKESNGVYKISHEPEQRVTNVGRAEGDTLTDFSLSNDINTNGKVLSDKSLVLNYGVCVMPTGIVIHDTDEIRVNIVQNDLVAPRYDLFVVNHEYLNIAGGQAPTYEIIKGTTPLTLPTIPSADKKIALGIFEIQPGPIATAVVRYKALISPLGGDTSISELSQLIINQFDIPIGTTDNEGIIRLASLEESSFEENVSLALTPAGFYTNEADTGKKGIVRLATNANYTAASLNATDAKRAVTVGPLQTELPNMNNNVVRLTTAAYTLKPEDNGKIFYGAASGNTVIQVTVPANLGRRYHVGFIFGTTNIELLASGTTLIKKVNSQLKMVEVGSAMLLNSTGNNNEYVLTGDLFDTRYN